MRIKGRKNKSLTSKQQDEISDTFKLFANRNVKNIRNKPLSENRAIGAYPHFNIDDGELTDDGEEIMDVLNDQAEEFSDSEYSDEEEMRVAHSYLQLPDHLGYEIEDTSDQMAYRKVGNNMIE